MIETTAKEIAALLNQAGAAHHDYEQTVLKGVYDREWPTWYAKYVLERGLNKLLNQEVTVEQLSQFLDQTNQNYQAERSQTSWAEYTAQKMVADWTKNF